jgi:RNA polymerase sigma factor for flagellar operon FliA
MMRGIDEPPPTGEQQGLVAQALPMVRDWAWRIARGTGGWMTANELLGPGTLALYEALRTYRPEQQASFEHYAEMHVRGRMLDAIRTDAWTMRERLEHLMARGALRQGEGQAPEVDGFHEETTALHEGMRRRGDDRLAAAVATALSEAQRPTPDEDMSERQEYDDALAAFESALAGLEPELRAAVLLVHGEGMGLEEASRVLGVHYNTAQRRVARGLRMLEEAMHARGVQHAPEPVDTEYHRPRAELRSAPRRRPRP